jgi:hypothetical protein
LRAGRRNQANQSTLLLTSIHSDYLRMYVAKMKTPIVVKQAGLNLPNFNQNLHAYGLASQLNLHARACTKN